MQFLYVLSALGALTIVLATDYCFNKICRPGKHHIACGNNGQFSTQCPNNARILDIGPHIAAILKSHNSKRNLIARGDLKGFKPAARMATMTWNEELASLAELNVKQCQMKHDKCRNTVDFPHAGQNLALRSYSGPEHHYSDGVLMEKEIESWWNEYNHAEMEVIDRYSRNHVLSSIGHFTVMVRDSNNRVGCAAARYIDGKRNKFLFACNYASNNIVNLPIYSTGETAVACQTGINTVYLGLCATSEIYHHYNDFKEAYEEAD